VTVAEVHAAVAASTAAAAVPAATEIRTRCPIGIARIAALAWSGRKSMIALNY
jgi:hypothetical protein